MPPAKGGGMEIIMDKLVQHIKIDMPGIPKQGLYCYVEASFEANQAMQEPLEKLYEDVSVGYSDPTRSLAIQCRIETLVQVKCDLESRLEELI